MNTIIPKPEGVKWTDDQWKAIVASGQDILVAAAAGSGKTAVLVERIIKKIIDKENPIDVDNLLVVTFTNASAGEMKERIGKALEKALEEDFTSTHLRKQLQLINKASISTLHSFCLQVIRQYYYLIDIDPNFRIANQTEIQLLIEEVMEELLEDQYSLEENELFFELVDRYTNDRSDSMIQDMVMKLFLDSKAHPNPSKWLDSMVALYDVAGKNIDEIVYGQQLFASAKLRLEGEKERLLQGLHIADYPDGPAPYIANLTEDLALVEKLLESSNWKEMYEGMQSIKWGRLAACKKTDYDPVLIDKVKNIRDKAKKNVDQIKSELFTRKPESLLLDIEKMQPVVEELISLVKEFDSRFKKKKEEKGIVDFSDLEHLCLSILREQGAEDLTPSEVALSYREKFAEVLVDEYQDVNLVQESILKLVAKEDIGNLFMVGDVKQSIYRFRLAEPGLFLGKHERFTKDGSENGMRIDLSQNFRSRAEVLDATNYVFKQIMGKAVGEIIYDVDAELKLGAAYPESKKTAAELIVINQGSGSDESEEAEAIDVEKAQLEGRMIAKKIKEMKASGYEVFDRDLNMMRPVQCRDFVILLRSMPWSAQITEELRAEGIPVYAEVADGYFEATEVAIMMNVLRIIDNPNQDIALASVLRSPIVQMTDEELAELRVHQRKGSYYEAMKSYLRDNGDEAIRDKITFLIDSIGKWRDIAKKTSLSDLIWQIYRDTGYYDFVGGMPGGKQRQANLRVLYDRARQYEATSFRGLFRFVRFVERMIARGDDLGTARALGEQEDVVRIMTIHKSKGLEFPVVFLAGVGKQFNMRDLYGSFLLHKDLGFGSKYVDPNLRIAYPTLPQLAIKQKKRLESIAEEMRVLYVAMTRAKEKLIMIGTVSDKEKAIEGWSQAETHAEWLLPDAVRASAKNYLDWIGASLIRHKASEQIDIYSAAPLEIRDYPAKWQITFIDESALHENDSKKEEIQEEFLEHLHIGDAVPFESDRKGEIESILEWKYEHEDAVTHGAKQSVSEIKRMKQLFSEDENALLKPFASSIKPRPRFVEKKKMTSAEIGTAMHMVMQQLHAHKDISEAEIFEQVTKMVNDEFLTEEQAENIDVASISKFFQTWIGQKLLDSNQVEREIPFTLYLSAKEIYPDWKHEEDESIIVQGIIDCIIEEEDGIILIDYKTDNISDRFQGDFEKAKSVLLERYETQLYLYAQALERILKKKVKERYLYFFDGSHVMEV